MKTTKVLGVTISAGVLLLAASLQARTWTEAASGRSLEGDFLRAEGEQVVIRRTDNTVVKIALEKLSDDDKKFVSEKAAPKEEDKNVFKWETDFEVAKKRAKDEKKQILADFTGSDWCHWCQLLKKEVFDEPVFQDYAKQHYIMLELDYPRTKELPPEEKAQNEKLATQFKIEGYPTVLILNSSGHEVGHTGYQEGGPEKYIENLKHLKK